MAQNLNDILDTSNPEFIKKYKGSVIYDKDADRHYAVGDTGQLNYLARDASGALPGSYSQGGNYEQHAFESGGLVVEGDNKADYYKYNKVTTPGQQKSQADNYGMGDPNAFRARGANEDMFSYLNAKQAFEGSASTTQPGRDPGTVGGSQQVGIAGGQVAGQVPMGGTRILDEVDLQAKRDQLAKAGIPEGDWSKYISAPDAQGRLFFSQPATLTSPDGERKIVASGSSEASQLLQANWTLGNRVGGGTIDSNLLSPQEDIDLGTGQAQPNDSLANQTISSIGVDIKSTQDQIQKNLELLQTPESDLSRQVDQLLGEAGDLTSSLTGRGALQLSEEERRNIEGQQQVIADKVTELQKKVAEVNSLTASYETANLQEEQRPQVLSRLRGQQALNYKLYLSQKNAITAEASYMQSELLGLQGKLDSAQAAADRAVELEFSDREANYNAKIAQLNILMPQLEKEEAFYATAVQMTLQQQADALAEQKASKQQMLNYNLGLMAQNPTAGITVTDTPEVAIRKVANAQEVIAQQVVSSSGGGSGSGYSGGVSTITPEGVITDPEVQAFVDLVNSGRMTAKQASDEISKGKSDDLAIALASAPVEKDTLQDDISREKSQLATSLKTHKGLNSSVGTTGLGRFAITDRITGQKQDFIASVEKLVSGLSLEALIEAKSRGATFGALSDTEMQILSSSASKIGTWVIKDKNGNVKGYNTSETNMKKELDNISNTLSRGLSLNRQTMPDGTVWEQQADGNYKLVE